MSLRLDLRLHLAIRRTLAMLVFRDIIRIGPPYGKGLGIKEDSVLLLVGAIS
jgi:hypothetical protein